MIGLNALAAQAVGFAGARLLAAARLIGRPAQGRALDLRDEEAVLRPEANTALRPDRQGED
jgi:hypothetical protein